MVPLPKRLDATFLPPYECFFHKLRDHNPLEKESTDFIKLLNSALKQLRLKKMPLSDIDNYNYLKIVREREQIAIFQDFVNQ